MGRERDKAKRDTAKRDTERASGRFATLWQRYTDPWKSSFGQIALVAAFFVVMGLLAIYMWGRFSHRILAGKEYVVTAENIHIPPLPPWIRTDLKSEAIVSGSLENLNVQQEDLSPRVAAAFKMHPWVSEVRRVTKRYPAQVTIDLNYRRPIAMVEVLYRVDPEGNFDPEGTAYKKGLYPVDPEGTLLPPAGFTAEEALQFPRIIADEATPNGTPGTAWGDPRIHGGAKIAQLLAKSWRRLQLDSITAHRDQLSSMSTAAATYELLTVQQTTIVWGHAPGEEERGEPRAERKVQRLLGFIGKHGSLDAVSPGEVIDLRQSDKLSVASREDIDLQ